MKDTSVSSLSLPLGEDEISSLKVGDYVLVQTGEEKFKFPTKILQIKIEDNKTVYKVVYYKYPKKEGETFKEQDCHNDCKAWDIMKKLKPPTEVKVTSR